MYNHKNLTYFFLIIIIFFSCQRQNTTQVEKDKITSFFSSCEKDTEKAANVIAKKELVKSLTHLQRMNTGGKKYYPLEREALTKMIKALSTYKYSDCILINKYGVIIYTMYDDDIFAKSIKSYKETPLYNLFYSGIKNNKKIADVNKLYNKSENYTLFFSTPIIVDNETRGVFITLIDIMHLKNLLPLNISITDNNGFFRIHNNESMILSKNVLFFKKEMKKYFIHYIYKNINWHLFDENITKN